MFLIELFSTLYPIKTTKVTSDRFESEFGDSNDIVQFSADCMFEGVWDVEFQRNKRVAVTGQGNAYKIFATVIECLREFINNKNPEIIIFGAGEESRQSLYRKMITKFAPTMNYRIATSADTEYLDGVGLSSEVYSLDHPAVFILIREYANRSVPVILSPDMNESKGENGDGDCFAVAGRNILQDKIPGLELVHALVRGQGKLTGRRFVHAWNELGDVVFDYSNGNKIMTRKEHYYATGKINPDEAGTFVRYTHDEALHMMASTGNFGPWDLDESLEE